jgi:hypothetical protein
LLQLEVEVVVLVSLQSTEIRAARVVAPDGKRLLVPVLLGRDTQAVSFSQRMESFQTLVVVVVGHLKLVLDPMKLIARVVAVALK